MLSGRMELGAATRIISTERKEVIINKTKTRSKTAPRIIILVDVDKPRSWCWCWLRATPKPSQTTKLFFLPYPFYTLSESEWNELRPRDSDSPFHLAWYMSVVVFFPQDKHSPKNFWLNYLDWTRFSNKTKTSSADTAESSFFGSSVALFVFAPS